MTNTWTDNEEAHLWALIEGYGLASVLDKMAALCETQSAQEMDDGTEAKAKEWDRAVVILDVAKAQLAKGADDIPAPAQKTVKISVKGGVAYVDEIPDASIIVEVIDYDEDEVKEDGNGTTRYILEDGQIVEASDAP